MNKTPPAQYEHEQHLYMQKRRKKQDAINKILNTYKNIMFIWLLRHGILISVITLHNGVSLNDIVDVGYLYLSKSATKTNNLIVITYLIYFA